MKFKVKVAIAMLFLLPYMGLAQEPKLNSLNNNIFCADSILSIVKYFTSKDLRGRLPGDTGYNMAANYASSIMKAAGLIPINKNDYFQPFYTEGNFFKGKAKVQVKTKTKNTLELLHGKDYVFRGFTGSGSIKDAEVVFCGYGIMDTINGYNDYENVDVKGKAVLIFKSNSNFKNKKVRSSYSIREKAAMAYYNGAKAVLFVSTPNVNNPQKPIGSVMHGDGPYIKTLPMLQIDISIADMMLAEFKKSLSQLQQQIDSLELPKSFSLAAKINIEVQTDYFPEVLTMNVAGILPGHDSILKNEYVIVGAHLDHVGWQGNIFYPGANDNASGAAVVLSIAKAMKKLQPMHKRSIIFVLFSCEEQGLQGAVHFVSSFNKPYSAVKAMFNFDCVGHGDSIQIGCGKSFPELWNTIFTIDSSTNKLMVKQTWQGGGADAQPFFEKGIPTAYFVSKYSYTHLHLPSDTAETLNPKLLEAISELGYRSLLEESNQ